MPRMKRVNRPMPKTINLPEDIVAITDLNLYSELEGKVPFGAWSKLIESLLREHFKKPPPTVP